MTVCWPRCAAERLTTMQTSSIRPGSSPDLEWYPRKGRPRISTSPVAWHRKRLRTQINWARTPATWKPETWRKEPNAMVCPRNRVLVIRCGLASAVESSVVRSTICARERRPCAGISDHRAVPESRRSQQDHKRRRRRGILTSCGSVLDYIGYRMGGRGKAS